MGLHNYRPSKFHSTLDWAVSEICIPQTLDLAGIIFYMIWLNVHAHMPQMDKWTNDYGVAQPKVETIL